MGAVMPLHDDSLKRESAIHSGSDAVCLRARARVIRDDNFCCFDQTWALEVTGAASSGSGV
jgi:hypothetical protein